MLFTVFAIIFIVISLLLSLFILVQSDKGGGISGAIGGGVSNANTVLGAQNTENILTRGTLVLAISFFLIAGIISFGIARFQPDAAAPTSLIKQSVEGQDMEPVTGAGEITPGAEEVPSVEDLQPVAPEAAEVPAAE